MNYAWKNRQYGEWELFPSRYLERECRHYWLGRHEKTNRTSIQADNIIERRRRSIPNIKENVYYTMTNKMSAAGRLGTHKYENPELQDFTERTFFIAEDIKAKNYKVRDKTIERLDDLQLKAINRPGGKLRPVLHQGYHKYKRGDFKMPRDFKQERADAKK